MKAKKDGIKYFYDTYALMAIARGEEDYLPYSDQQFILTSIMNVYELYYSMIKDGMIDQAELFVRDLAGCCLEITPRTIMMASHLRKEHSKKKISYIDSLGYVLALREGIPFLTGDKEFKNLPNVKFIK